ncbi:MAG: type IV pilus secretin PilQ, partial [Bdellovibrionaceae bacterium]|nr:type IV pilus secretin PilQ [Pseudobdellovibrionaceae bacterium]
MLAGLALSLASCGGMSTRSDDDDFAIEDSGSTDAGAEIAAESSGPVDEFAEFEEAPAASEPAETAQAAPPAAAQEESLDEELALNDEAPAEAQAQAAPAAGAEDELSLDEAPADQSQVAEAPQEEPSLELPEESLDSQLAMPEPVPEAAPEAPAMPAPAPIAQEPAPEPEMAAPAEPAAPAAPSSHLASITGIKYKANDNGGTIVIEANGPITHTVRTNPELRQMIIEVPDVILPKRLQRPLNTRDIQGSIGAIDPYQNSGSSVARFVVQLRDGANEPAVQQEGNTLLVVANMPAGGTATASAEAPAEGEADQGETQVNVDLNDSNILSSQSLSEYLSGNTKFYGKKISVEMNNADIREVLRFIMEESGVNMVISEEVKGNVSVKLRQVPWDQALVVIMRAKQLGYTRQGNVLRIAPIDALRKEEDDATRIAMSKKEIEPLKVRVFPVSYARVAELEKKVSGFVTEKRGKVVGDERTNSLVVTDVEDNLQRIAKLIQSLDIQPPQVLIEGKIVEAAESFQRAVGINWGLDGTDIRMGTGKYGPVNLRPSLSINPTLPSPASGRFGLNFGVLDGLGNLDATLALEERNERVKVLSSPRVVTLSNEQADISQTNEVPVRTVTPLGQGTSQVTYTFKPLTLRLEVVPQIAADSSVIMKVKVKREFKGADAPDGAFSVNAREANTRVLVQNGQTAVIGGIYQSDATEGDTGVPWLKDIPVVGTLFRTRTVNREKAELLVFLTPRILATSESLAKQP